MNAVFTYKNVYSVCFLGEQSANSSKSNEDTEVVCENGVCYKKPKQNKSEPVSEESTSTNNSSSSSSASQLADDAKLARAKELIEKKRKDKEEEDAHVNNHIIYYQNYYLIFNIYSILLVVKRA